jgi:putative hydrolase of the HAD superfamily
MITTLFLDIGGVLLSNGWDTEMRKQAIKYFKLDAKETEDRHHMTFDAFESGKMTISEYLKQVVFYEPRSFNENQFVNYMNEQTAPFQDHIDFFKMLKEKYELQVIAISNEPRELNEYRIRRFHLKALFDAVISSSFVHFRKPDKDIFRLAIDISQAEVEQSVFIDDRLMFIEVAKSLGLQGIQFTNLKEVKMQLSTLGLSVESKLLHNDR